MFQPSLFCSLLVGCCRVANLIFHSEIWVDFWLLPFEMVPSYLNYAWSRMAARFKTKLGLMFALK